MKSKQQVKAELHQLIESIEDENILNVLNEDVVPYVIQNRSQGAVEDELTTAQRKELEEAIAETDKGGTVSFDEFKISMDRWVTQYKLTNASK